jgi:hypothetical protein
MIHDEAEKKAREIVGGAGIGDTCSCDTAYSERKRTDPRCTFCNYGEFLTKQFTAALLEASDIEKRWPSEEDWQQACDEWLVKEKRHYDFAIAQLAWGAACRWLRSRILRAREALEKIGSQ